ncbi:MAG: phosphatase PAP2 family protein [Armatimonadota bacterium]|nr:phosphatase PAP2 family protein [Armatimonadota bacterium]
MRIRYRRKIGRIALAIAGLFCASYLTGCGGGGAASFNVPPGSSALRAEPTGGQWVSIVLASVGVVPAASPPAAGSPQANQERQELQSLQQSRTAATDAAVNFWNAGAVLRWNEIARDLVKKHRTPPPVASRLYALVSVAQYDALIAAFHYKYLYNRPAPRQVDNAIQPLVATTTDPVYPSEHAVVAAASAAVLAYLYPDEAGFVAGKAREHQESRLQAGVNWRSDIIAGDELGRAVAAKIIERARADGADSQLVARAALALWWSPQTKASRSEVLQAQAATDPGRWTGTNPVLPEWGRVRPWLMSNVAQFRPDPPPAFDSPEFQAALAEVRQISDTRTAEQLRIAQFWADGAGTSTPPGHWNQFACDQIAQHSLNEIRAARTLALMNMAVMDAGICCWDAKYTYWLLRPWQADTAITTPVGQPNFPSYTSGHATFSGAAAEVLGYIFPDQQASFRAMADEAALSRLYGGIHYRFDSDIGIEGGRRIGQLAIERGRADRSP